MLFVCNTLEIHVMCTVGETCREMLGRQKAMEVSMNMENKKQKTELQKLEIVLGATLEVKYLLFKLSKNLDLTQLNLFLSDEGPMLETLDYTIRIGSTPTFLYFDLYLYSAYAAHFVY